MTQDLTVSGINQNFNEYQGTANVQQLPGVGLPAFYLKNGPPTFSYPIQSNGTASFVGTNYSARNADWIDPHIRAPYVMMWSAGFQYEISSNWLAEFMYNGNAGVGLLEGWNINQIPLNILFHRSHRNVDQDLSISAELSSLSPVRRRQPVFSNFGHGSTYHSGTASRAEKRFASNGLMRYIRFIRTRRRSMTATPTVSALELTTTIAAWRKAARVFRSNIISKIFLLTSCRLERAAPS